MRNKNPKDFDILTLFLSVKRLFYGASKCSVNEQILCCESFFRSPQTLSHMTALPSILNWNVCSLFFLSYLYISLSRMFVLTPYAVQVAVLSDLWHFWMNLVVYILSHAMFSKGMLHWSALADALQHHECDHYVQMIKKKSTIEDDFLTL